MSLLIKIPGTLNSVAGLERVMPTNNGFPSEGLTDLLLLNDGAGTAPVNAVSGAPAGTIEAPVAINNAFSWLGGGGGVQLEGTQIISLTARDASLPWSLVLLGAITGSVGGTGSERITGLLGFKQFTAAPLRGAALYARGGNDWNVAQNVTYFQHRKNNNGANATAENLLPSSGITAVGPKYATIFAYNGTDTVTSTVYDKNGTVVASDSLAANDAEMFTVSGVTLNNLNPCAGLSLSTYSGGIKQVEAFARYDRVLSAADITRIIAKGVALGTARGRPW